MFQLMEMYHCRDRRTSAMSAEHVCKHTLGVRGLLISSEVFSSHIHLQNGTFPGNHRRLTPRGSHWGVAPPRSCWVNRVSHKLSKVSVSLVEVSGAADWPQWPSWTRHGTLDRCSRPHPSATFWASCCRRAINDPRESLLAALSYM